MLSRNVFLIGFSGSGKSSIGVRLARRFDVPFYDSDAMIEEEESRSISQIFKQSGESHFRLLESDLIKRLCNADNPCAVIALGGGAVQTKVNRNRVLRNGLVVYLSCAGKEIYKRLQRKYDRPLMSAHPLRGESPRQAKMRRIRTLLGKRTPYYRMAHIRYSTTRKSVDTAVRELFHQIKRYDVEGNR